MCVCVCVQLALEKKQGISNLELMCVFVCVFSLCCSEETVCVCPTCVLMFVCLCVCSVCASEETVHLQPVC